MTQPEDVQVGVKAPRSYLGARQISLLAKSAVIWFGIIYACGFLITAAYSASYGFLEPSPFRPKLLAAGCLFILLSLVPAISVDWMVRQQSAKFPEYYWFIGTAAGAYVYYASTYAVTMVAGATLLAETRNHPLEVIAGLKEKITFYVLLAALLICWTIAKWYRDEGSQSKAFKWYLGFCALLGVSATAWLVTTVAGQVRSQNYDVLRKWFLLVGLGVLLLRSVYTKESGPNWALIKVWGDRDVFLILIAVSLYSTHIYPKLQPAFGGGAPMSAFIYLNEDTPFVKGRVIQARVLDESEHGLYVELNGNHNALFISRGMISAVYFSKSAFQTTPPPDLPPSTVTPPPLP